MDTIGEFLTRIRNAGLAGHEKVDVPSSNVRVGVAKALMSAGYLNDFRVVKDSKQGVMRVYLKYDAKGKHMIKKIYRVSTPGLRKYSGVQAIPKVRSGYGVAILSTSKGIMSGEEAIRNNVGGELLCKVW